MMLILRWEFSILESDIRIICIHIIFNVANINFWYCDCCLLMLPRTVQWKFLIGRPALAVSICFWLQQQLVFFFCSKKIAEPYKWSCIWHKEWTLPSCSRTQHKTFGRTSSVISVTNIRILRCLHHPYKSPRNTDTDSLSGYNV